MIWVTLHRLAVGVLPIQAAVLRPLAGRISLRHHRKILIVDNGTTYCGSQHCADPGFRVNPKYAAWVDIMVRLAGPVAIQNQRLFVIDWMLTTLARCFDACDQARRRPVAVKH